MKYPKPKTEPPKPKRRVYKPMKFGEGVQPGTVEWELNQRRFRKEQREDEKAWAQIEAGRVEQERPSFWQRFIRRIWPG